MRATSPGRSAATVTPCTAAVVPITGSVSGHGSARATIVVTASGGGWKAAACATAVWICWNLTAPRPPITTAVSTNIRIIRFNMAIPLLRVPRYDAGAGCTTGA